MNQVFDGTDSHHHLAGFVFPALTLAKNPWTSSRSLMTQVLSAPVRLHGLRARRRARTTASLPALRERRLFIGAHYSPGRKPREVSLASVAHEELAETVFNAVGAGERRAFVGVRENRADLRITARAFRVAGDSRDAADVAGLRADLAFDVRGEHPALERAFLVAIRGKGGEERFRVLVLAHIKKKLHHLRRRRAVLARQSRAVRLRELLELRLRREKLPHCREAVLGSPSAFLLPRKRSKNHLGVEVPAGLETRRERGREVALPEGELPVALLLGEKLRRLLDLSRHLDTLLRQRLFEHGGEEHRGIVDRHPRRHFAADLPFQDDRVG